MKHVQVIIASVRPSRIGDQVADWVIGVAARTPGLEFELVDLGDWPLPMDDEPWQPKKGGYVQPHTMAWSRKIAKGDGYVFVTPQYNWGYPASLKNALDHLYDEWGGKPALIVTYGHRGGVKCAAQLREVLTGLHMATVDPMPALILKDEMLGEDHRLLAPALAFAPGADQLAEGVAALSRALEAVPAA